MGDDFFVCKYISFCTKIIASNPLVVSSVGYLLSMLFAVYKVAAWNHKHRARAFSPSHNDVRGREGETIRAQPSITCMFRLYCKRPTIALFTMLNVNMSSTLPTDRLRAWLVRQSAPHNRP